MTGPRTGASSIGTPTTLITRPMRSGPAAWASVIIPIGMIMPPAMPWRTRKAISASALQAGRTARSWREGGDGGHPHPLGTEPLGRPAGERDDRGQRQQVAGGDPLDRRQRRVSSRDSVWSATLTIVVSRIDMIAPTITTIATARTSGVRRPSPLTRRPGHRLRARRPRGDRLGRGTRSARRPQRDQRTDRAEEEGVSKPDSAGGPPPLALAVRIAAATWAPTARRSSERWC